MEPLILDKVYRLCARFADAASTQAVIRLEDAYMALTMDVICHYAYGESDDYLADEDFRPGWRESVIGALENGIMLRNFPWALPVLKSIPLSVLQRMNPNAASLIEWTNVVKHKVEAMMQHNAKGNKTQGTIFQTMDPVSLRRIIMNLWTCVSLCGFCLGVL
jgi:hypothetical protein